MAKKKKSKKRSEPAMAAPLDYSALMRSANEGAAAAAAAQVQASVAAYPEQERLQLETIQKIAANLDNQYTRDALAGVNRTVGDASTIRGLGADMRGMAGEIGGIGRSLQAQSGETNIERTLRQQAEADLALGRSLSAEETRDAQQSARSAFAARGLGTSMGSAAAEILNRDSAAQARESARRNFAASTNQMVTGNVFNRYGQAAGLLGSAAQVNQGAANAYAQGANIDQGAAQMRANLDPQFRALGYSGIGGGIGQNLTTAMGQTWRGAQELAGGAATFNANMLDTRYNSYMNNQASLQAARMQAGAMNRSATMGMLGSAIQGGIQAGGMIGAAQFAPAMFSDRRMKKDIKPLGKAGSVLGLTTYEYSYKGDDKKRVGFMAQDVQKVLPEAVTELNYKGQKRLAIKPAVIGAALAEELMAAKAA
jgi:hypothetical protein